MSEDVTRALGDLSVDRENLYREETITDLKVATIRVLAPIKEDGSPDSSRETIYLAQTQLMSQAGPVPIQTQVEAKTLDEALDKFPDAIKRGVESMVDEARKIQRDEASRIVVPGVPTGKIIS